MNYEYNRDHIRLVTGITVSDTEKMRVKAFLQEIQNLDESNWIREGMKSGVTIRMGNSDAVETQFRDWEQMQVVLMRLRPLLLQEESTNFESVRKMIIRNVHVQRGKEKGFDFKQAVRHQTRGFEGSTSEEGILVNGILNISSRKFLTEYLYSEEYHRNLETRALIEPALRMQKEEIRGFLSITLFHIVNSIHMLRDIMKHVVDGNTRTLLE